MSDTAGYIPIRQLGGGATGYGTDLKLDQTWRPDPWDRDYNRKSRFNSTRVQRKLNETKLIKLN